MSFLEWLPFAILIVAFISPVDAKTISVKHDPSTVYEGWKLVWSDEFNKDGPPNPKNWNYESGFVRNQEIQWYQEANARIKNGKLVLEARRERRPNPNYDPASKDWARNHEFIEYTSASLTTQGKHSWKYGRFEMRARIDTRLGLWPAYWTLGEEGEWPGSGEIDMMEFYRGKLLANVAWGTDRRWEPKWDSASRHIAEFNDPKWSEKFHHWRMDWDEHAIKLYVDGILMNTTELKDTVNPDGSNPFHRPQYLLLSQAVWGQNGGDPTHTEFPARFEIDYVRVYQKASNAHASDASP